MGILELLITAIGLSMDATAVSAANALTMRKVTKKKMLIFGLYFGVFQALMPLIGYLIGSQFAGKIEQYDHWVAFVLLALIGGKMLIESFNKEEDKGSDVKSFLAGEQSAPTDAPLTPAKMIPLAIATSIDALAVGVSFAVINVNILHAVLFIGVTTFLLSAVAVKVGGLLGSRFKNKAELFGGVILMIIGLKILLEHLNALDFLG